MGLHNAACGLAMHSYQGLLSRKRLKYRTSTDLVLSL